MKKTIIRLFLSILTGIVVIAVIFYFLVVYYYRDGFPYNTWVNGVYCTGKSIEEANSILIEGYDPGVFTVRSDHGDDMVIELKEAVTDVDFTDYLKSLYGTGNKFLWFAYLKNRIDGKDVEPKVTYSKEIIDLTLDDSYLFRDYGASFERKSYIAYNDDYGYVLYTDTTPVIKSYDAKEAVFQNIRKNGEFILSEEYFEKPDISDRSLRAIEEYESVSEYFNTKIIYDMGDEMVPIDGKILSSFVTFNDDGTFLKDDAGKILISDERIGAFVESLAAKYDTYLKPRTYKNHFGDIKTFNTSYYGTKIDINREKKYLINAVRSGITETHRPFYIVEPFHRGLDDIGNEFIEVDLTNQRLYYLKDGEVLMDTDVVTGRPGLDATPEMVCNVYKKQKNAVLVGEDYRSPVAFWMPIYKGIGLHDASWQRAFGGDRYLTHGSHGCINMQKEDAESLYEQIEVGIPVIIYK